MIRIEASVRGFNTNLRWELFRQLVLADFHNELRLLRELESALHGLNFPFLTGKARKKALRSPGAQ